MAKSRKFGRKYVLVRIDLECLITNFETKIKKVRFFRWKIVSGTRLFFDDDFGNGKAKKNCRKMFWTKSIRNVCKPSLKRTPSNWFLSYEKLFFLVMKNDWIKNVWSKFFWSKSIRNISKVFIMKIAILYILRWTEGCEIRP